MESTSWTHRPLIAALLVAALARPTPAKSIAAAREEILRQTMPYLNVPYLWGGTYPRTGLDCSGFVQLVYHQAGLSLPRVTSQQFGATRYLKPSEVLPGDLIFFAMKNPGTANVDHVGIYVGKGLFIAASTANGIHIEPITNPYYFQRLVGIRRYGGF